MAIIASALSVPDPRDRPADKQTQADQKHAPLRDEQSDFLSLLKLWRAFVEQREQLSRARLRGWCKDNFLSYLRLTEWQDVHGQVMEVVKGELALKTNTQPATYDAIHRALLAGLLSQVAQRKEQGEYLGANGTKLFIHPGSGQFKARPPWIVSAEQVQTSKVYARNVARIDPLWVEQVGEHLVRRQYYEPHWERRAARAAIYERTTLFGLTLASGRSVPFERVDPKAARELFIRHALVRMEYDSRAPFLAHNLKLLEETEYLQQKGRRVDLLVRREPAVRILRCARPGGHLHRRRLRALAPRGRGQGAEAAVAHRKGHCGERCRARGRALSGPSFRRARWWCSCATASSRATRTMASRRWCRCTC